MFRTSRTSLYDDLHALHAVVAIAAEIPLLNYRLHIPISASRSPDFACRAIKVDNAPDSDCFVYSEAREKLQVSDDDNFEVRAFSCPSW